MSSRTAASFVGIQARPADDVFCARSYFLDHEDSQCWQCVGSNLCFSGSRLGDPHFSMFCTSPCDVMAVMSIMPREGQDVRTSRISKPFVIVHSSRTYTASRILIPNFQGRCTQLPNARVPASTLVARQKSVLKMLFQARLSGRDDGSL